jgi:hypothetical protein
MWADVRINCCLQPSIRCIRGRLEVRMCPNFDTLEHFEILWVRNPMKTPKKKDLTKIPRLKFRRPMDRIRFCKESIRDTIGLNLPTFFWNKVGTSSKYLSQFSIRFIWTLDLSCQWIVSLINLGRRKNPRPNNNWFEHQPYQYCYYIWLLAAVLVLLVSSVLLVL